MTCTDEQPEQLTAETRRPPATRPGSPAKIDYEHVRRGVCCVWMFDEPLGGRRDVRATTGKTAVEWARQVRELVDHPRYADAERITLVCDRLNTHRNASFREAFPPAEAHRPASKIELIHTPRHGPWLNVAECELGVPTRQCSSRRIAESATVEREAAAWATARNRAQTGVDWQFTA